MGRLLLVMILMKRFLKCLEKNKAVGPDGVRPNVLRTCSFTAIKKRHFYMFLIQIQLSQKLFKMYVHNMDF